MKNPIATTGLLVAAMRAEESLRPDRLFEDPFAERLAGDAGRAALVSYREAAGVGIPIIEVRTRFYDEGILRAAAGGIRQFVVLAAGMDARSFRLPLPDDARVFEVDQAEVIASKDRALAGETSRAMRVAIAADLAGDWPRALTASGFDPSAPSCWLVEGLLQYLDEATVNVLFARIDALSASQSRALYDVVSRMLLASPMLAGVHAYMNQLGAAWKYGNDAPALLLEPRGWDVVVHDPAIVGSRWNRWPLPPMPGKALGALVEATRR